MWTPFIIFTFLFVAMASGKASSPLFTANVVEQLVKNEVQKKMPSAAHSKKKSLKGFHLKEATDAINKLVDESIVDRVQEAEREVSKMLLKSIEHHIQDAGKVLMSQDENVCRDKLDSCDKLADSGVCETSKDAMIMNCPDTCNFCGMLKELKLEKIKEDEEEKKPKKKKKHKHKHHRHHFLQTSKLNPEETQMLHQNMIDQTIDHSNLPMATNVNPDSQSADDTATPSTEQENNESRDYNAEQQQQQQQQQQEEADRQKEEEEREEEQRKEKERRKRKKAAVAAKAAAKHHAKLLADKEDYFTSHCHPLCAKECIESCAPGCCDHRVQHEMSRKRCHPMCRKICLPSCGVGCCAAGVHPLPQPQAGMCPPGCPLACAPHCLDSCCFPSPPPPRAIGLPLCYGSCLNSCDSRCPASCCPSNMGMMECAAPCESSCAPLCMPECCGARIPRPPPRRAPPPTLAMAGPLPEPFDTCPGTCPTACAPGCDFDCCRPFLDPGIVQEMMPPAFASAGPPPAPPMSRVIHVEHVLTPQQPIASAPAVSEVPATCPAECQQHCGPACARDGCCTDRKRKRSSIPRGSKHHRERTFELREFDDGLPVFYVDQH